MTWLVMAAAALAGIWYIRRSLPPETGRGARAAILGVLLAGLALSVTLYLRLGSPGAPDAPLDGRSQEIEAAREADDASRNRAAGDLESARQAVEADPGNVEARFALAEAAARAGDSATEIAALEAILEMTGNNEVKAMIAEALSREAGGIVTARALAWVDDALATNPADWRARYLKGLHLNQTGDDEKALDYWAPLAKEAVNSPIYPAIENAIRLSASRLGVDAAPFLPDSDVGEADIAAMVDGLESRLLAEDGVTDREGWMMLVRSRIVLGDEELLTRRIDDLLARLEGPRENPWLDSRLLVAVAEMMLPADNPPETVPPVLDRVLARARELAPDDIATLFFSGLVARQRGDTARVEEWWGRLSSMLDDANPIRPMIDAELERLAR